jgi:hypothetical protein
MEKSYILEKRLNGFNSVLEVNKKSYNFSGLTPFPRILGQINHWIPNSDTEELRKSLCLKKEDFSKLLENGYASGNATNNIEKYISHKRELEEINNTEIKETDYYLLSQKHKILFNWYSFLDCQVGEGDKNSLERLARKDKEYEDYYSEGTFGHT